MQRFPAAPKQVQTLAHRTGEKTVLSFENDIYGSRQAGRGLDGVLPGVVAPFAKLTIPQHPEPAIRCGEHSLVHDAAGIAGEHDGNYMAVLQLCDLAIGAHPYLAIF